MLLLELRDATVIGISHDSSGKINYFKCATKLTAADRSALTQEIYSGRLPRSIYPLPVEELLKEIEGKKARHIWLESVGRDPQELGFLSISELRTYFRSHTQR
jgi:hypothetical protein